MKRIYLALALLLCWLGLAQAQTSYATLSWDEPTSFPSLPGTDRLVYTLYRRGFNETVYRQVRALNTSNESYPVAVPQGVGYVCYRVQVLQAPIGGITVIDTSPWAEVQGFPGCRALCLRGNPPYPALASDECAPPL